MKIPKICPQCNANFPGRSNQLYCTDRCKVEAFREGKTRKADVISIDGSDSLVANLPSRRSQSLARATTNKSTKSDLEIRRLELAHDRELRQMDLDEKEQCRKHEMSLAQLKTDGESKDVQLLKLTKKITELEWKTMPPLDEWTHFSTGIRRQYQALARAVLEAVDKPMYGIVCSQWLDEYRPFNCTVQDLMARNNLPDQVNKPFIWLADLAKQIDSHQHAKYWSEGEQDLVLNLSHELRLRLTQACL